MSQFRFVDGNHSQGLLRGFNELRKSQMFCDVTLKVNNAEGTSFQVHSQLLAAASAYFKELYERVESNNGTILLDDISNGSVLEQILDFVYTGTAIITTENVHDIFKAAVLLQMESLKKACASYMERSISRENCLQFMLLGTKHQCPMIVEKARELASKYFTQLCMKYEFLQIDVSDLKAIVSSDALVVKTENEAYQAVKKWIEHDLSHRLKFIPLLLSRIRFRFLPREFLKKTYAHDPIMMTSLLAQDFVHEALIYETLPAEEQKNVHTSRIKPRWCTQSQEVISLLGGMDSVTQTSATSHWVFDPTTNQWFTASPLLSPRHHFGLTRHHDNIYVFGGSNSEGCENLSAIIEVYDAKLNQWTRSTRKMKQERSRFEVVTIADTIYLVGGMCIDPHRNTVESFHVNAESSKNDSNYSELALPKQPRYDHCTVVLDDKIYFIGGCTRGHSALQTVECYNPLTNVWINVAPLLVPRSGACAVVHGNCIVVIGGSHNKKPLNSCEMYDPNKDEWMYMSPMNERRDHCTAVVFQDKIYVFGGSYGQITNSSVECYSAKLDRWKVVTHLPSPRHGFKCLAAVVNRTLLEKIHFEQV